MKHVHTRRARMALIATVGMIAVGVVTLAHAQRANAPQYADEAVVPRVPAVQLVDQRSRIDQAGFELFRDHDAWTAFWSRHASVPAGYGAIERHAAPKIDFARYMVICVLGGKRTNTDGITCESVVTADDLVRVRIEDSTYQTMRGFGEVDPGDSATPFGFFVIDKATTRVVIEKGTRSLKNEPVKWNQVHEFAAPGAPEAGGVTEPR